MSQAQMGSMMGQQYTGTQTGGDLLLVAKVRLKEVKGHLAMMAALEAEKDTLERMIFTAENPPPMEATPPR